MATRLGVVCGVLLYMAYAIALTAALVKDPAAATMWNGNGNGNAGADAPRQAPPTLQHRRSQASPQHTWMLDATDASQTATAAMRAHYGGWSVHDTVEQGWQRLKHAQTPEALSQYNALRNDHTSEMQAHRPSETYAEFARGAGLLDTAEVQDVLDAFDLCFDNGDWDGLIEHLMTDDVTISELSLSASSASVTDERLVCHGREQASQCLNTWANERRQRCAQMKCERATYVSDTITSRVGPVLVQRVVETLHGRGSSPSPSEIQVLSRTLHVFFMIVRPPFDTENKGAAPLSHSRIAVIEHMQTSLPNEYDPPLELAHQARRMAAHVDAHERQWQQLHRDAVAEVHDRLAHAQRHDLLAYETPSFHAKLRQWCERRYALGEDTGHVDCSVATDNLGSHSAPPPPPPRYHRRRNGKYPIPATAPEKKHSSSSQ